MTKRFHLRLSHKIMAIGIVGLAGTLAFGAISQFGSRSQNAARAVADKARQIAELNQQLSIEMLEARRNEKNFQIRKDETYARNNAELSATIDSHFDQLQALMQASGRDDLAAKTRTAQQGFRAYADQFTALVKAEIRLGLNETLGLTGALRTAVRDIETRLKEIDSPKLMIAMLSMRRHEKDFMLRRDQKYVGEHANAAAEFSKSLAALEAASDVKAGIARQLETYQKEFLSWTEVAKQVADMDGLMMKTFRAMEPLMVDVGHDIQRQNKEADATEAALRQSVDSWMLIALALAAVVVGMTSFLIGGAVSRALSAMVRAMSALAGGDTAVEIPSRQRKDEIGEMAAAVQVFRDNSIETARLRTEQTETEQKQQQRRKADMNVLADRFETAVGEIIETVSSASNELEASANSLTQTADSTQELSTIVASASEEASTNVQSVALASEEMASSVNEISRQVQESARIAMEAVAQAHKTTDRVNALSQAAGRIDDVVDLINTIASQTNLLALNATIEAARAGDAGRGFAVVASEVKALADQTAKATGEISQQIGSIQLATKDSVTAIEEISITIGRISEIASTIAAAVEEQGAATQEVSRNVQLAARGTQQVASNISEVQRGASETGSASSQVLASAQSLSQESNRLKLEVGKFLGTVRAA